MKPLKIGGVLNAQNRIEFCDERERAPFQVPAGTVASITLESADSSWGEFLTLEEVAAVRAWCDALLVEAFR